MKLYIYFADPVRWKIFPVILDVFARRPEKYTRSNCTAEETINKLSTWISCFKVPETLVTNNDTQFASNLFKKFRDMNGIIHLYSPLYHFQSNRQAERLVDTFERVLLKGREDGMPSKVIA